jgi:hypothetical protein
MTLPRVLTFSGRESSGSREQFSIPLFSRRPSKPPTKKTPVSFYFYFFFLFFFSFEFEAPRQVTK